MKIEFAEALWLDPQYELTLIELAELSGLSAAELQHLVDCEALLPVATVAADIQARFSADWLVLTRKASRLRTDFDLDVNALGLTLQLLRRIHELESQLHHHHAQIPQPLR